MLVLQVCIECDGVCCSTNDAGHLVIWAIASPGQCRWLAVAIRRATDHKLVMTNAAK